MEAASLALSASQTLLTALQCPDLREMSSIFNYKSHLDDELQNTVSTVKAVLKDAETKQELSNHALNYIQKLKDAVYDADDLFDKFVTIAQQKQLMQDGKVTERVRLFFSRSNPLVVAFKMLKRAKKIKRKFEGIANDHNKFGFWVDSQPIRKRREETCSYVYEGSIVGREYDVEKIVSILLDSNVQLEIQQDVFFLSIVGIQGLGKTALAQLLFNDERVTHAFSKRLWTCVSDHDQQKLDLDLILRKILTSATGAKYEGLPMEEVQKQLRGELASNRYLLVLDDVWTENRSHWLDFVGYLLGGQRGSWILVTTRSEETAKIIGSNSVHKLQGLSEEDSWNLFMKMAFGLEQTNPPDDDLVAIGEKIVKGCAGVPLALRVVGSLLYGQDKSKWVSVQTMRLAEIREYSDVTLLGSGHCSSPGSGYNSGYNSMGDDISGHFWQQPSRGRSKYSPVPSPRTSPGPSSRVQSGSVTPIHPRAADTGSEAHARRGNDGRKRHHLPLPHLSIPNPSPFSRWNSAATSPSVPRSPTREENLPSPTSGWKKGRLIGRGTFGHVYLGFNSETGEMCAMKEVTLFSGDPKSRESANHLQQEIALFSHLRHPNIVQYFGSETVGDKLFIYMEYVSGGSSIYKLLQEYGQLGELAIRNYTQQLLSGLAFLHGRNIVHRDIKGANILVDTNGRVKLADFGTVKHFLQITVQSRPLSFIGSPHWMAPEVIKNSSGCNPAVDIWSLGCTVLEMATTKPLWSQYNGVAAMFKICNSNDLPAIPDHLSDEGKRFCEVVFAAKSSAASHSSSITRTPICQECWSFGKAFSKCRSR